MPGVSEARTRRAEDSRVLIAHASGIGDFEDFVDGLSFARRDEKLRVKLAGSEIFDNLVRHAAPLETGSLVVRAARRGASLYLAFYFKSLSFGAFAATSACGRTEDEYGRVKDSACLVTEDECAPFFDPAMGRWRGIGLRMCRCLSSSLLLRSGSRMDRIFIRF
jgi:hypothetical protein